MERREVPSSYGTTITDAPTARSEEIRRRQVRYILSMLLRTLCFVGAVIASGWLRWTLVGGAVFLPYIAVVLANAASQRRPQEMQAYRPDRLQLEGGDDRRVL